MQPILIDTHAHLYAEQFDNDRAAMLKRADTEGVKKIFLPAIDSETHAAMLALEASDPTLNSASKSAATLHGCRPIIAT